MPEPTNPVASQEIRFAVVMYGGVSLAIYIHGVAQELLRLVRATSGADVSDDRVAAIYKEIAGLVRDQVDRSQRCQTRFVVDILSGTSAGGINAVFLAKALAIRSKDLEKLRQTWLTTADMNKLLNRGGVFELKRSLLKGNWMYQQLYKAFSDMNGDTLCDKAEGYAPVEQLDLFVTTTDLNGVAVPIRLADMDVPEKIHKGVFHFRWDNIKLHSGAGADPVDSDLAGLGRGDFQPQYDAMLAFASRSTSSFPIAFPPMKLADIEPIVGERCYQDWKDEYCKFFRWVPSEPLIEIEKPVAIEQRELADGGYLDNKPFGHAIDALTFRSTRLRHTRKLLFVDPFPEIAGQLADQAHFDFVDNALDAAMNLPRYQTIREELDRLKTSNVTRLQLREMQDRVKGEYRKPMREFTETTVDELTELYGPAYGTYHMVRLLDTTDDLARTVSGLRDSVQSEDFFLAVRYLVRAWRQTTYAPNTKPTENDFFTNYDYSFRMRRAAYLLEWAQSMGNRPRLCESLIRQLTRLHRKREQLSLPNTTNPIWKAIVRLGRSLTWDKVKTILEPIVDQERMRGALLLYRQTPELRDLAAAIGHAWTPVFDLNRSELKAFFEKDKDLEHAYQSFDFGDMVSLAFLEGSNVSDHTITEVYRISPADGIQRPLKEKLAGYAVQDFGAFLKLEWRQNDILWGRLDACERIVSAILNHDEDEGLRKAYVARLQNAIVTQEAQLRTGSELAPALEAIALNRLEPYLRCQYLLPDAPPPKDSARQIAQSADILGRMIEDDLGKKGKPTALLQSVGGLAASLVGFITPRSLGRVFWNYWLALLGLASAVLLLIAWVAGNDGLKTLSEYGIFAVLVVWFLSRSIGNWLSGKGVPHYLVRVVKWLSALAVVVLAVIGILHFRQDAEALWRKLSSLKTMSW